MSKDDSLRDLIERVEKMMLEYTGNATLPNPSAFRTACRTAAAEYATILIALRAHMTQENPNGSPPSHPGER